MSRLHVRNIRPVTGSDPVDLRGVPQAWVRTTGASTITDSENVSSISELADGEFEYFPTNSLLNDEYVVIGGGGQAPGTAISLFHSPGPSLNLAGRYGAQFGLVSGAFHSRPAVGTAAIVGGTFA